MSDGAIIMLIILIFAVCLGFGLFLARFLNGWLLLAVMVALAWLGNMLGGNLTRGQAFSSLGSAIFFIAAVLPGVFGFGVGAVIAKYIKGRTVE